MSSITATFVFTDLVDSTALASRLRPDEADELRARHFSLLRSANEAAGGVEVKNLGDGLMLMYTSTTRALAGAVAMQQAIERHNRRGELTLAVRIGIATGEATEEDGDFFGEPVIAAARLCAAAAGGQILATELTANLVGRHAEQELVPVGSLDLKGLAAPVPSVEVRWESDAADRAALPPQLVSVGNEAIFAFFGRVVELSTIQAAVKAATTDRRLRAVLIGGEPGLGKTSLAAQAARDAYQAGAVVLFGAAADGICPPYGPWIGALAHLVASLPPEVLGELDDVHAGVLRRLLPAVADRLPQGESILTDPDAELYLRMEAVVAALEAASVEAPVVIVLDDLQWADSASLALLRHLIASPSSLAVAVIATHRTDEAVRGDQLGMLLADAHHEPRVERIDLKGLSDAEIVELMGAAAGRELDAEGVALAHALHRETDGNAFFVTEMLRHLSETGEIAPGHDGHYELARGLDGIALPASVRDVVGQRVARLGEETERILATAATIGPEFDVGVLSEVCDIDEDALLDVLERAIGAALVTESPDGTAFRFAHALVRHSMAQTLSTARRHRLHGRIAQVLEERGGASSAELARHLIAAARTADAARARRYARDAGRDALAALAPEEGIRWFRQALDLLDDEQDPSDRERCLLLIDLATAHRAAGRSMDAREAVEHAGAIATDLDDPELLVAAGITLSLGSIMFDTGDEVSGRLLRRALDSTPGNHPVTRARLLSALLEATDAREWRTRHALAGEARAEAARSADRRIEVETWLSTYAPTATPDRLEERLVEARRALDDRELLVSPADRTAVYNPFMQVSLEAGRRADFEWGIGLVHDEVERYGLPLIRCSEAGYRSVLHLLDGDAGAGEAMGFKQYELLSSVRHPTAEPMLGVTLLHVRRLQGRLDEIVGVFADAAETAVAMPVFNTTLALLHAEVGQLDEARLVFDRLSTVGFDDVVPRDQLWLTAMCHCARTAALLGDESAARALRAQLLPYEANFASTGMTFDGSVAGYLALLDVVLDDRVEAGRHFDLALGGLRTMGACFWLARTLLEHARFLREADATDPRAEAHQREGVAIAEAHGFAGLVPPP